MYRLRDTVRINSTDEGGIVLDLRQGRMYDLNPIAAKMMDYLAEGRAEDEITDRLIYDFAPISRQQVAADLHEFLEILLKNELLESVTFPNSSLG